MRVGLYVLLIDAGLSCRRPISDTTIRGSVPSTLRTITAAIWTACVV